VNSAKDIESEAADWLSRLEDSAVSAEDRTAFENWRASNAKHAAAFVRLEAVSRRLDRLAALRPSGGALPDPNLLKPKPLPRSRVRTTWLALAATLTAVGVGLGWRIISSPGVYERHFTTERGSFERTLLPDGSVLQLNTSSDIRVRYYKDRRLIQLTAGEATFEVARDPVRPFLVQARDLEVRAVGTAFTVRLQRDHTEVLVTEGRVALTTPVSIRSLARDAVAVEAGQSAVADRTDIKTHPVAPEEAARELAWHIGMLSFENDTLADIVSEFNRYNSRQIKIEDPALAARRMGGYFRATNLDAFVSVLERQFSIRAVNGSDGSLRLEPAH